jgi:Domain of unknown function (DUF4157)
VKTETEAATAVAQRHANHDGPDHAADETADVQMLRLQRFAGNSAVAQRVADDRAAVEQATAVGGSSLPANVRADMESALGADFSAVKVYTDPASTAQLGAHAYTTGEHIVFAPGQYDTSSATGRGTLAHELTHVVQQRAGSVDGTDTGGGVKVSNPGDRFEREAYAVGDAVAAGQPVQRLRTTTNSFGPSSLSSVQRRESATESVDHVDDFEGLSQMGWFSLVAGGVGKADPEFSRDGWLVVAGLEADLSMKWGQSIPYLGEMIGKLKGASAKGGIYAEGHDAGFVGKTGGFGADASKGAGDKTKELLKLPKQKFELPKLPQLKDVSISAGAFVTLTFGGKEGWSSAKSDFSISIAGWTAELLWDGNDDFQGFGLKRAFGAKNFFDVKVDLLKLFGSRSQIGVMRDPHKWWIDDTGHIRPPERPMFKNDTMRNAGGVRQFEEQKHRTEQEEERRKQEDWFRSHMPALYKHGSAKFE